MACRGKYYEQIKKISYYNNLCDMCGFDYCTRNLRGSILLSTTASIEEYCKENSFKGAESFDIEQSSELDGYLFCVSKDGDDSKGQELFIFL